MSHDLRIGVAGATGALGQEVVAALDGSRWRPDTVVPLARAATTTPFVTYGDEQVAVDDLAHEALDGLNALILAVPRDVALSVGRQAIAEGVPVIDASGALAESGAPLVVPWVNPEALADLGSEIAVALPSPAALLLASVLGPLRRAGVEGAVEATVLLPASAWGRQGVEELSNQVISLFNQGTPSRKVFPSGLAFDLLPMVGGLNDDGWTADEVRTTAEVQRLLGAELPVTATLVGVPVFTGVSAQIHLHSSRVVPAGLVEQVLRDGGVRLPSSEGARDVPRPRRVDGVPLAHVGRIRADPGGDGLHLWASMDNLRGAAAVAVGLCGAILKQLGDLGDE